jgi:hypothetical protein
VIGKERAITTGETEVSMTNYQRIMYENAVSGAIADPVCEAIKDFEGSIQLLKLM